MNAPVSIHPYDNIPSELKELRQWVVWKYEQDADGRRTKILRNPFTGAKASSTGSNTWNTFSDVVAKEVGYDGIGFVLSDTDPYVCIDLDNKTNDATIAAEYQKIIEWFDSYTETSPSGYGYHIWVIGDLPPGKRHSGNIEIYDTKRYMTFTGKCTRKPGVIEARQEQIESLVAHISSEKTPASPQLDADRLNEIARTPEAETDNAIFNKACNATNGAYFQALWNNAGWQEHIGGLDRSQSVADQALINMLVYYTKNANQVVRLFHKSALGKRDKAQRRDYLQRTLERAYDREIPKVHIDGLDEVGARLASDTPVASAPAQSHWEAAPASPKGISPLAFADGSNPFASPPPGLLGDIAQFIYAQSPRQIVEISTVAAIGLLAGIVGRSFQVNGDGLNLYLLMLAETGMGKDAINSGIHKLISALKDDCVSISGVIGPKTISSAQALNTTLQTQSCFVSIIGEFGLFLSKLAGSKVSPNDEALQRALLEVYGLSARGKEWGAAAYADKSKNTSNIVSPSLTILGEGTPTSFFDTVNNRVIEHGLISRFLIIEYAGKRPYLNENSGKAKPDDNLLLRLKALYIYAGFLQVAHTDGKERYCDIQYSNDALSLSRDFERDSTDYYNNCENKIEGILWTRVHAQVSKLASIVAISRFMSICGVDYNVERWWERAGTPTIEVSDLRWAINFVTRSVQRLSAQFANGEIGANNQEQQQLLQVCRVIAHYLNRPINEHPPETRHLRPQCIIPYRNIQRSCVNTKAFNDEQHKDKASALKRALDELENIGALKLAMSADKSKERRYEITDQNYFIKILNNETGNKSKK